jgi:hypothetical protein
LFPAGEDFDQRVMEYFMKLIKKKYKVDISKDSRAKQKLRREAERAKRALSSQHQVRSMLHGCAAEGNVSRSYAGTLQCCLCACPVHPAAGKQHANGCFILLLQVLVKIDFLAEGVDLSELTLPLNT